jgi:hypothetical protein
MQLQEKQTQGAAKTAREILELPELKIDEVLHAARVLARCSSSADAKASDWKHQSIAALSRAVRAGWRDLATLESSADFHSLRDLPEFQKLMASVKK